MHLRVHRPAILSPVHLGWRRILALLLFGLVIFCFISLQWTGWSDQVIFLGAGVVAFMIWLTLVLHPSDESGTM